MKKILLSIILFASLVSCKVQFMPTANQAYINQITDANNVLDSVLSLGVNCDNSAIYDVDCNDYSRFKSGYEFGELYVNNLIASYSTRDKGARLKKQADAIKELYDGIYAYHAKSVTLSPESLYAFRKQIDAAFQPLIISEQSLKPAQ